MNRNCFQMKEKSFYLMGFKNGCVKNRLWLFSIMIFKETTSTCTHLTGVCVCDVCVYIVKYKLIS